MQILSLAPIGISYPHRSLKMIANAKPSEPSAWRTAVALNHAISAEKDIASATQFIL